MIQYPCSPRLSWEACPSDWDGSFQTFYIVTLTFHLITLITYIILFIVRFIREKKSWREYLSLIPSQIDIGVILYSLMITINHISLLTKEPLLPIVVNELTFNGYNLGIFLTLMLLIQQWAVIPLSIDRLKSEKYARIARTAFYSVTMIIGSTLIATDLTLFTNPEAVADTIISFQHHLWGIACLLNGVLYGIFGYSLIRSLSQTIAQNEDNCTRSSGFEKHKEEKIRQEKSLLLKFKLIYYLYVSISGPYAVLYFIVIYVKSDPFTVWLLVYTVFNMAGPLTALILAPISYR